MSLINYGWIEVKGKSGLGNVKGLQGMLMELGAIGYKAELIIQGCPDRAGAKVLTPVSVQKPKPAFWLR